MNTEFLLKRDKATCNLTVAIYPFLIYGLLAWGSTYTATLTSIVILQKKAVQITTSSKNDAHTSLLFHQLSVNLPDLVSVHKALFMFDFYIILFYLRFQISLLQYEKLVITTQDFHRDQRTIHLLFVQTMESLV